MARPYPMAGFFPAIYRCEDFIFSQGIGTTYCTYPQGLVGERVTDVFPALEGLYLEEFRPPRHVRKSIRQFIAARLLLGRLVAVSRWKNDSTLMSGIT